MKINQVEQQVGITKKNIRFYEEQGLLHPVRNADNGYREYTQTDVDILFKIKLLRKLSVPIEEIRRMQENRLSLSDCLNRHIIYLEHEAKNISLMKEICGEINRSEDSLPSLDASAYLMKMQQLEEGGMRFMDIGKEDRKKKKYGPLIAAAVMITLMCAVIILFIWAESIEPIPLGLMLIFIAIPAAVIVGVLLALRQRLIEIEKGEENEASKY